jgi:ribose/xylose/arabinose/galactoside ABC-type transport system permease subunit
MPRDMGMVVTLFLALAAMVIGYAAFGQGGGVAGMVFFGVLLIGAIIRIVQPQKSNA